MKKSQSPGEAKQLSLRLDYYLKKYHDFPKSKYFVPLAETYLKCDLFEEAAQVLQEGLKWNPTYFIGRALLAQTYFHMGHFTQSLLEGQKVVHVTSSNLLALRICATSALKLNDFEKAKYFLDQLLKLIPNDQETLKLRAHIEKPQTLMQSDIDDFQRVDLAQAFKKKTPSKEKKLIVLRNLLEKVQKSS